MQERVSDLETAMMLLETSSEERCLEVATAATHQIRKIELEKDALHSTLFASQADIAVTNQLKLQVSHQNSTPFLLRIFKFLYEFLCVMAFQYFSFFFTHFFIILNVTVFPVQQRPI